MSIFNMVGGGSSGGGGYKTYNQLKAMSLSDALTELNTDAQGYYDNLNGNGHIIGIGIANNDKTTYQCWDVSPIIYWNGSWRNGEIIIVKIKADNNGNLLIPKAGYGTGGSQNASYNWRVSYDNGSETQYSGTGSTSAITIASGLTADTEHTIIIRPNSESYGWARAFGYYDSGVQTLLTEIIYDSSYKGYGSSSTNTNLHFRRGQYRDCTSLTAASIEVLPNSVTSIGTFFRYHQYDGCTSITTPAEEIISTSITTIGNNFRSYQYAGCTSLTNTAKEILPNTVTTIGNNFRSYQYTGCTSLTNTAKEILPNTVTTIGDSFRSYQYRGCTSLTVASQEVLPNTVTTIGDSFRSYQYAGCTSLTVASQEVLPNSVTSIGNYFRGYQYRDCTSLTVASQEVLPNSVTSIGTYFRTYQYRYCTSLTEIQGWKDLSIGSSSYRSNQFDGTGNKIVKVLSDVGYASSGSSALPNSTTSVVLVPSAYLSNFTGASVNPRSSITDSKFVGY